MKGVGKIVVFVMVVLELFNLDPVSFLNQTTW